ncbi:proton-coupled folate transporter-like [Strongylocentrotus purpuratus]|uniref:Proton-coupled folate transporter n=1 Tax=Strongylocentrotus purpuratus TaxID=7668 RepID=A0A7M7PAU4_STRPU|nr:proton-coupled folate transporter-like [Strongylocentrotus purpuratus]
MESDKTIATNNNPSPARRSWRSRLIVEPLTVTFMLAYGLLVTIRVEYLNKRLSEEANFTQPSTNTSVVCSLNTSSEEYDRYLEVQTQTSYWTLYLAVAQSIPALFSANFLGALSDARGRRIAMLFPIVGFGIYSIVYALVAQFHWSLYFLFAGAIPLGLCGDFLTLVACSFAYVADTTTSKQRTYRMVILECLTTLGAGAGQVLVGFMIEAIGYPPVYYAILCIMVLCALYVYLLPESHPSVTGKVPGEQPADIVPSPRSDFNMAKFFRSLADLFRPDPKGRCWKMISYNYILFQSILMIVSFLSTNVLFAEGEPFCWSAALIGIFNGLTFIFAGLGLVVGGYVLRLFFSDHCTMQISMLSFVACLVMTAYSKTNVVLFCGE